MTPLFVSGASPDAFPRSVAGVEWRKIAGLRVRLRTPAPPGGGGLRALLFLHDCDGSVEEMVRVARLDAAAEAAGMLVACPQQDRRIHPRGCWRWTGGAEGRAVEDEVERILDVSRAVAGTAGTGRVFLAGFGTGGAMAVRIAASDPARFAGLAVHSGVPVSVSAADPARLPPDPTDASADTEAGTLDRRMGPSVRPLPLIVLHGTADERFPPALGEILARGWMALHDLRSGDLRPPELSSGRSFRGGLRYRRAIWRDGEGGLRGEAWQIEGLGHEWSGGRPAQKGVPERGPDATREILRFFDRATAG